MFKKIFIENEFKDHPRIQSILDRFSTSEVCWIEDYAQIWGKVKKPYLQKRDNLNLFIARKKGQLVKEAPDAYGVAGEKHFYYIHAYNCIYECEYCYLQGYFNTPDIVIFLNHDEIRQEMQKILNENPNQNVWFHAGEFSDSLALSHITDEHSPYWSFFSDNPRAKLELRTKSVNIKPLLNLEPINNAIISFSLSSVSASKDIDFKTPSFKARLSAIEKLQKYGYRIALHFDPIVYSENVIEEYQEVIKKIHESLDVSKIAYLSIGVVRFTSDVLNEVQKNYPDSKIHAENLVKSFDSKMRYNRPMRMWLLNSIKQLLLDHGFQPQQIYLCME